MKKLTMEQAVVVSGYTGICTCPFEKLHKEVEKRLGRPVFTHEFASSDVAENIKDAFRDDFIAMCPGKPKKAV